MPLDVDAPPPPHIAPADAAEDEYRRKDIQRHLEESAWTHAFDAWAAETDMETDEFAIAVDLGLFDRFDFFWDAFAGRVGYAAPGIPEDWKERDYHDDLTRWKQVSAVNAGLAELGQTVCDVLLDDYLEVEEDSWGDDLELPDFE